MCPTAHSVSRIYGEIFDGCREIAPSEAGVYLDIVKLKTVREHLTVDLEPPNMEFEQMAPIVIHLPLLNFDSGHSLSFGIVW